MYYIIPSFFISYKTIFRFFLFFIEIDFSIKLVKINKGSTINMKIISHLTIYYKTFLIFYLHLAGKFYPCHNFIYNFKKLHIIYIIYIIRSLYTNLFTFFEIVIACILPVHYMLSQQILTLEMLLPDYLHEQ